MTPGLTWDNIFALSYGFGAITFQEFCAVLAETNGADEDYCRGVWPGFQGAPLLYCRSRRPVAQGRALFELAMRKAGFGR